MRKAAYVQHVRTRNDSNGNPRRLFVFYASDGETVAVFDEGYSGFPSGEMGPRQSYPELMGFTITPGDYRETVNHAKVAGTYHRQS